MRERSSSEFLELSAFQDTGHRDLGLRVWDESREAADQAWRECRSRMRSRYGARSPHDGWSMFVLFAAVLCAAVAAVLTGGLRSDPSETMTATVILAGIAGVADLAVLLAVRWRPMGWAGVRMQIGLAIALGAAAALQVPREPVAGTPVVLAAGAIGVAGLALVLVVRAVRPAERAEIDTAIVVAVTQMRPEVDATAARLQAEVLAELSPEEQERIVALRDGRIGDGSADGVPAGGVIIASFLTDWNTYLRNERARMYTAKP